MTQFKIIQFGLSFFQSMRKGESSIWLGNEPRVIHKHRFFCKIWIPGSPKNAKILDNLSRSASSDLRQSSSWVGWPKIGKKWDRLTGLLVVCHCLWSTWHHLEIQLLKRVFLLRTFATSYFYAVGNGGLLIKIMFHWVNELNIIIANYHSRLSVNI